ncbi:hypothetical protein QTG54_008801, partial [Skeletonema marinoi]
STYAPAPARFEAGTPAIVQAIGLGAEIDYINDIGMDRIQHDYEVELANYLRTRLNDVGSDDRSDGREQLLCICIRSSSPFRSGYLFKCRRSG